MISPSEIVCYFLATIGLVDIFVYVMKRLLTEESELLFDSPEEETRYRNLGEDYYDEDL